MSLCQKIATDNYYLMSKAEFNRCKNFLEVKICQQEQPIFPTNNDNHCEVNFFFHNDELTNHCDIQLAHHEQFWIELHESNKWLF